MNTTTFLGDKPINRIGYGAMQLTGPGVFGLVNLRLLEAGRDTAIPLEEQVSALGAMRQEGKLDLIGLSTPGRSSIAHLEENMAATQFELDDADLAALDRVEQRGGE